MARLLLLCSDLDKKNSFISVNHMSYLTYTLAVLNPCHFLLYVPGVMYSKAIHTENDL